MKKIYLDFNDLDHDTQRELIEEAEKFISTDKKNELKAIAISSNTDYQELLRTESEGCLKMLDVEFNI